ncbi:MAG: T9SS type A sorting domain-containing protein [Saprospiraceae bacterium]
MKNIILSIIAFSTLGGLARAQSLQNKVVAAGGESFTSATASLDWTLGETVVQTWANGVMLAQGFHQVFELATPVFERPSSNFEIKVYPNPATDWLALETDAGQPLTATLYDLYGRTLLTREFGPQTEKLDLSALPPGTYLLGVADEAGPVQTFKFQKIRF